MRGPNRNEYSYVRGLIIATEIYETRSRIKQLRVPLIRLRPANTRDGDLHGVDTRTSVRAALVGIDAVREEDEESLAIRPAESASDRHRVAFDAIGNRAAHLHAD